MRLATKLPSKHEDMLYVANAAFEDSEGVEMQPPIRDCLPASYYRAMLRYIRTRRENLHLYNNQYVAAPAEAQLEKLLKNNLSMYRHCSWCRLEDTGFLCAEIDDVDLPWPLCEVDW